MARTWWLRRPCWPALAQGQPPGLILPRRLKRKAAQAWLLTTRSHLPPPTNRSHTPIPPGHPAAPLAPPPLPPPRPQPRPPRTRRHPQRPHRELLDATATSMIN